MLAHNLNYNWDLLPQESSVYRVPPDLRRHLETIHHDLLVSWFSECRVCKRAKPGDMNHCPNCRRAGRDEKQIGGMWAFYIAWPMYYHLHWSGGSFLVIEKRPWLLTFCEPWELSSRILLMSRLTYGRPQDIYNMRNLIEASSALRMRYLKDEWKSLHRDRRREGQKVRRLLTDDPGSPMISTFVEGRPHATHAGVSATPAGIAAGSGKVRVQPDAVCH